MSMSSSTLGRVYGLHVHRKETEEKKLFSAAQRINFHETTEEEEDQRWSWETFEKNKKYDRPRAYLISININ